MTTVSVQDEPSPSDARQLRFGVLYDELHDDLWRYCRRRSSGDDIADDVLAEVMSVAWERLDDIPDGPDARPWLFAVARNKLRKGWQRRRRSDALHQRLVGELRTRTAHHDRNHVDDDTAERVLAALHSLRPIDQEVIRLAAWERLTHREIGIVLGCSENAAAIRLHRARTKLDTRMRSRNGGRR